MVEIRKTDTFVRWFEKLRDKQAKARILVRIDRAMLGNLGDATAVGGGVSEMRIHYGPGYRLYFTQSGEQLIILLVGGDKSTQARDIQLAIGLAEKLKDNKKP